MPQIKQRNMSYLFFLVVHSNNGYIVVATIVIEKEDTASLSEALQVLSKMNPAWSLKAFMVDSSEIELNALATVFKGASFVLLVKHMLFKNNFIESDVYLSCKFGNYHSMTFH